MESVSWRAARRIWSAASLNFFWWLDRCSPVEDRPNGGEGLLLTPGFERIDLGSFLLLLQFVDAVGQIAQAGQCRRAWAAGCPAGIFTQGDVPAVMGAVFNGRPVTSNGGHHFGIATFV